MAFTTKKRICSNNNIERLMQEFEDNKRNNRFIRELSVLANNYKILDKNIINNLFLDFSLTHDDNNNSQLKGNQ